jgi:hypothetical protein
MRWYLGPLFHQWRFLSLKVDSGMLEKSEEMEQIVRQAAGALELECGGRGGRDGRIGA